MIFSELSYNEKVLLKKCADVQLESFIRISHGHPLLDELLEIYKGELDRMDILSVLTDELELWELLKTDPENAIKNLRPLELMLLRWILMDHIPTHRVPKSRECLLDRINLLLTMHQGLGDSGIQLN